MVDYPNIFGAGMSAFDDQTRRLNAFAQQSAAKQAGAAIANGDPTGAANVFNRAGMVDQAHNVIADQQVIQDRQTAAQNLAQDRAAKLQQQKLEAFGKLADMASSLPQGQRLPWIQQHAQDLVTLGLPADRLATMTEADLSDQSIAAFKAALGKAKLQFLKVGNDQVGVDDQGNVKTTFKGPITAKKDEQIYAPDNPGYGGPAVAPGAPPTASVAPQATTLPAATNVTPQDRDALARMMVTEAGGEGPGGMAAVAHVALNRLNTGYGGAKSLSDVVNAPGQFEGMSHAGSVHPQDLARAQAVANQVIAGQVPDPTNGATQFLNPELQAQLGRAQPAWATGDGLRIGRHVFYGGGKGAGSSAAVAAINAQGADSLAGGAGADTAAPAGYHLLASGPKDPADEPMSPEAITMGATQIAMTGKPPQLGMGKAARNDRKAMMDEAAQLIKKWDISPEDWVNGAAPFKIAQGSLAHGPKGRNKVEASGGAVEKNMDNVVMPLMAKAQPGGIPFLNKYIMAIKDRALGDPDVKAYDNALHSVADEYAKVMTTTTGAGGQGLSDSARNEAYRRLSTSQTPQQLQATLTALKSEMANRRTSLMEQEGALRGQLRNGLTPGNAAPPVQGYGAPAPASPPAAPAAVAPTGWGKATVVRR